MNANFGIDAAALGEPSRNNTKIRSAQSNRSQDTVPVEKADNTRESFKSHLDRQARTDEAKKAEQPSTVQADKTSGADDSNVEDKTVPFTNQTGDFDDSATAIVDNASIPVPLQPNVGLFAAESNLGSFVEEPVEGSLANSVQSGLSATQDLGSTDALDSVDLNNKLFGLSSTLSGPFSIDAAVRPASVSSILSSVIDHKSASYAEGTHVNQSNSAVSGKLGAVSDLHVSAGLVEANNEHLVSKPNDLVGNTQLSSPLIKNGVIKANSDLLVNTLDDQLSSLGSKTRSGSLLDVALANSKPSEGSVAELAASSLDKSSPLPVFKTAAEGLHASSAARMQVPATISFGQPGWAGMVADRTAMMASQKIEVADIQLDPPELGPLQIKVQVQNEQTVVSFVSGSQAVRDSLEQASHRLKDMMEEQGLDLVDVDVSDQESQDDEPEEEGFLGENGSKSELNNSAEPIAEQAQTLSVKLDSGIDDFV